MKYAVTKVDKEEDVIGEVSAEGFDNTSIDNGVDSNTSSDSETNTGDDPADTQE